MISSMIYLHERNHSRLSFFEKLFLDSSFVSETVDCGNIGALPVAPLIPGVTDAKDYTGPSIYGIWGSLGTIRGGESVGIP